MIGVEYARMMARYNRWMNERLYECCARLADEQRKRDTGAFFRSIHGTLNHLLLGDRVWLGRFVGPEFRPKSLAEELYADFTELRAERAKTDDAIDAWVATLSDAGLRGDLTYTSIVNPAPRRYPMGVAVAHFFNHQTHHRGQLTALLMQQGIDPGVTDLIWLTQPAAVTS
ncbi:MAG TPA: DinB family protein [Usitatibacter sp.]|nr:DinB family protein [Usitatibacter sp.]